jgi:hypothetical protein
LYHYGLKDKKDRNRKIKRYEKYDPKAKYRDRSYYEALKSNTCEPLDKQFIKNSLDKEIVKVVRKKVFEPVPQKFVYVEKDGRRIDVPEKTLPEYIKQGFQLCE